MNLKLSKTAIRELTKRYRAVLLAAVAASAFVATGAGAADITEKMTLSQSDEWTITTPEEITTVSGIASTDDKGAVTNNSGTINVGGASLTFSENTSTQHGAALYNKDQTAEANTRTSVELSATEISFNNN